MSFPGTRDSTGAGAYFPILPLHRPKAKAVHSQVDSRQLLTLSHAPAMRPPFPTQAITKYGERPSDYSFAPSVSNSAQHHWQTLAHLTSAISVFSQGSRHRTALPSTQLTPYRHAAKQTTSTTLFSEKDTPSPARDMQIKRHKAPSKLIKQMLVASEHISRPGSILDPTSLSFEALERFTYLNVSSDIILHAINRPIPIYDGKETEPFGLIHKDWNKNNFDLPFNDEDVSQYIQKLISQYQYNNPENTLDEIKELIIRNLPKEQDFDYENFNGITKQPRFKEHLLDLLSKAKTQLRAIFAELDNKIDLIKHQFEEQQEFVTQTFTDAVVETVIKKFTDAVVETSAPPAIEAPDYQEYVERIQIEARKAIASKVQSYDIMLETQDGTKFKKIENPSFQASKFISTVQSMINSQSWPETSRKLVLNYQNLDSDVKEIALNREFRSAIQDLEVELDISFPPEVMHETIFPILLETNAQLKPVKNSIVAIAKTIGLVFNFRSAETGPIFKEFTFFIDPSTHIPDIVISEDTFSEQLDLLNFDYVANNLMRDVTQEITQQLISQELKDPETGNAVLNMFLSKLESFIQTYIQEVKTDLQSAARDTISQKYTDFQQSVDLIRPGQTIFQHIIDRGQTSPLQLAPDQTAESIAETLIEQASSENMADLIRAFGPITAESVFGQTLLFDLSGKKKEYVETVITEANVLLEKIKLAVEARSELHDHVLDAIVEKYSDVQGYTDGIFRKENSRIHFPVDQTAETVAQNLIKHLKLQPDSVAHHDLLSALKDIEDESTLGLATKYGDFVNEAKQLVNPMLQQIVAAIGTEMAKAKDTQSRIRQALVNRYKRNSAFFRTEGLPDMHTDLLAISRRNIIIQGSNARTVAQTLAQHAQILTNDVNLVSLQRSLAPLTDAVELGLDAIPVHLTHILTTEIENTNPLLAKILVQVNLIAETDTNPLKTRAADAIVGRYGAERIHCFSTGRFTPDVRINGCGTILFKNTDGEIELNGHTAEWFADEFIRIKPTLITDPSTQKDFLSAFDPISSSYPHDLGLADIQPHERHVLIAVMKQANEQILAIRVLLDAKFNESNTKEAARTKIIAKYGPDTIAYETGVFAWMRGDRIQGCGSPLFQNTGHRLAITDIGSYALAKKLIHRNQALSRIGYQNEIHHTLRPLDEDATLGLKRLTEPLKAAITTVITEEANPLLLRLQTASHNICTTYNTIHALRHPFDERTSINPFENFHLDFSDLERAPQGTWLVSRFAKSQLFAKLNALDKNYLRTGAFQRDIQASLQGAYELAIPEGQRASTQGIIDAGLIKLQELTQEFLISNQREAAYLVASRMISEFTHGGIRAFDTWNGQQLDQFIIPDIHKRAILADLHITDETIQHAARDALNTAHPRFDAIWQIVNEQHHIGPLQEEGRVIAQDLFRVAFEKIQGLHIDRIRMAQQAAMGAIAGLPRLQNIEAIHARLFIHNPPGFSISAGNPIDHAQRMIDNLPHADAGQLQQILTTLNDDGAGHIRNVAIGDLNLVVVLGHALEGYETEVAEGVVDWANQKLVLIRDAVAAELEQRIADVAAAELREQQRLK
jgi:hypothetical protein